MPRGKKTTTTKRKRATAKAKAAGLPPCEVKGCTNLGMETHEGPSGPVHLCGRCGELARRSLRDERARIEVMDLMATPMEKALARQTLRRQERVHAAVR